MDVKQHRGVIAVALVAAFMVFVDATIVNIALSELARHLHASRAQLEWAINAYTVSFASAMLGAGTITDTLGARRAFMTGLVVFAGSSGICAAAGSIELLDLARLVQGAGAAMLLPSALVLATASAPSEEARHRLVGRWAAAGGAGMAAGPLLGGALIAIAGWRSVFAVNLILGVPAIAWSARAMPRTSQGHRRLDVGGMASAAALIGGLVFTLIQGPAVGWASAQVLIAAALALTGLTAFVRVERTSPAPILPRGLYRDRAFLGAAGQGALFNFAFYGLLFALSLMIQQGRGLSPLASGLLFLPLTGVIPLASISAARLSGLFGRLSLLVAAGTALTCSLVAIAWASTAASLWPLATALVPAGFSAGVMVTALTSEAIGVVEPALHGAASAAFNTARQVGGAVGVATLAPLLGTSGSLAGGFTACLLVSAAATASGTAIAAWSRSRHLACRDDDQECVSR